jgi:prepilin-type N-terminal cleavage/methylation domain-containing protein
MRTRRPRRATRERAIECARPHGFSLIELLVVITILGGVLAMAIPNFARFVARDRVDAAAQELQSTLTLARQKALARRANYRVTLTGTPVVVNVEREQAGAWIADPVRPLTLNAALRTQSEFGGSPGNTDLIIGPQGMLLIADAPAQITLFNDRGDTAVVRMVVTGRIRSDVR